MSRRPASIVLSVVFGVLALVAWGQVLVALLHFSDEVPTVNVLHTCIGFAGAATAWGSWRRARWAAVAAIAYGAISAVLLIVLPSLLHLPDDARRGIWTGAAAVMVFALLCAGYFWSDARHEAQTKG